MPYLVAQSPDLGKSGVYTPAVYIRLYLEVVMKHASVKCGRQEGLSATHQEHDYAPIVHLSVWMGIVVGRSCLSSHLLPLCIERLAVT